MQTGQQTEATNTGRKYQLSFLLFAVACHKSHLPAARTAPVLQNKLL
jgi:hypothetical protein